MTNLRLYDISTRIAAYVEAVKRDEIIVMNQNLISQLDILIGSLLGRIKQKTLDKLTQLELAKLIIEVRRGQRRIYNDYSEDLIDMLNVLSKELIELNKKAWITAHMEIQFPDNKDISAAFATEDELDDYLIENGDKKKGFFLPFNTIMAATGMKPEPFIRSFGVSAQAYVENAIRKGYADRRSPQAVLTDIAGLTRGRQGFSTILDKVQNQSKSVINTSIAHVANQISLNISSQLFNRYIWISIMDNRTTDICIGRHLKTYVYGKGPLPPAHINCRSHVSPLSGRGKENIPDETLLAWMNRQPSKVQKDLQKQRLKVKNLSDKIDFVLEK